jgi:hypothetical protein
MRMKGKGKTNLRSDAGTQETSISVPSIAIFMIVFGHRQDTSIARLKF